MSLPDSRNALSCAEVFSTALHHTLDPCYLLDCVLQLPVKYTPIGHNDDGIEDPICIGFSAEKMRQEVCQPRDRVRFAAPLWCVG